MTLPLDYYTATVLEEIARGIEDYNLTNPEKIAQYPKEVTINYAGITFTVPFKK